MGRGFYHLLDGLNPERILVASEALGTGRVALDRAVQYAKDRIVFGRPIGQNQGIQFPLADSYAKLKSVELLIRKASWLYDIGQTCGPTNMPSTCLRWGFDSADRELSPGGFGYAK